MLRSVSGGTGRTAILSVVAVTGVFIALPSAPAFADAAAPASLSCTIGGRLSSNPGLTAASATATVQAALSLDGCSTAPAAKGPTIGVLTSPLHGSLTCSAGTATGRAALKWNGGATSTATLTVTLTGANAATVSFNVTSGAYRGRVLTSSLLMTPDAGQDCSTVPVTGLTLNPTDPVPVSHNLSYDTSLDANEFLVDGSDHGDPGQIVGQVTASADATMPSYLAFPPPPGGASSCTRRPCPHGVVTPMDSTSLRPTTSMFAFGATVRLDTPASETAGMNVIQRGLARKFEPQWKAQADYGYASCRWSDGFHTLMLGGRDSGQLPLQVGTWYAIRCAQLSPTTFTETVTDVAAATDVITDEVTTPYSMGGIAPSGPVTIGSKSLTGGLDKTVDQFHGDMTDIFVQDGSPPPTTD